MARALTLALVTPLAAGCGHFAAGSWEDDPDNWSRAFRSRKPDDVEIVRSWYERAPHWTLEFEYYFHVRANDALKAQLFGENDLQALDEARLDPERPAWFAPGAPERYEAYRYARDPFSRFRVYVDLRTDDLYLSDAQF